MTRVVNFKLPSGAACSPWFPNPNVVHGSNGLSGLNKRTVILVDFFSFCCTERLLRCELENFCHALTGMAWVPLSGMSSCELREGACSEGACSKVASSVRPSYNKCCFGRSYRSSIGGETVSTGLQGGRCVPRTMASLKIWN